MHHFVCMQFPGLHARDVQYMYRYMYETISMDQYEDCSSRAPRATPCSYCIHRRAARSIDDGINALTA